MRPVIVESPYAGNVERNLRYLRACILHSLSEHEAPFASHGFYTLFLEDADPAQRRRGLRAGQAWGLKAGLIAVYDDLGITPGMKESMELYSRAGIPIEFRMLGIHWDDLHNPLAETPAKD